MAVDGRTRIDLRRHYVRGKLHSPLRIPYSDSSCSAHRDGHNCHQHSALLRIGGSTRSRDRTDRNGRDSQALVVSVGLHWCPDRVERAQRAPLLPSHLNRRRIGRSQNAARSIGVSTILCESLELLFWHRLAWAIAAVFVPRSSFCALVSELTGGPHNHERLR